MVVINKVPMESASNWEVQCKNQLQQLGLSVGSSLLVGVRSHSRVSSPEYEDDFKALRQLIRQCGLQSLTGDFTLRLDYSHEVDTFLI